MSIELTSQIGGNADVFYSNHQYDTLYTQQAETLNVDERATFCTRCRSCSTTTRRTASCGTRANCRRIVRYMEGWKETKGGAVYNFTRSNYLTVKPA